MRTPLQRCLLRSLDVQHRLFHSTRRRDVVKPFLLADIGEGIRECQIIQWFVQPGARVEQFDKLCEVQSDKAAVEITSPFDGVVKELHYEPDDMAIVGKPLLDIDIHSEISPEDAAKLADTASKAEDTASPEPTLEAEQVSHESLEKEEIGGPLGRKSTRPKEEEPDSSPEPSSKHQTLATPAVRHLTKEHNLSLSDIHGTGKEGRILKEDVHRHMAKSAEQSQQSPQEQSTAPSQQLKQQPLLPTKPTPLTPIQAAMFRTMTASLSIPHFLYTTPLNLTPLTSLRTKINPTLDPKQRLTPLPFILKAVSKAFLTHPLLNASLDVSNPQKPLLNHNPSHDFGVAVDTPSGLLVPVVRAVQDKSVAEIAAEIKTMAAKAREGKLASRDMQGATFTISNIGAIGGGAVAPVIVGPQVGILGVGRGRIVPVWVEEGDGQGGEGTWERREEAVMSWCADHRVVDGAQCARVAEVVSSLLDNIEGWVVEMR